jgi:hypothetical protein
MLKKIAAIGFVLGLMTGVAKRPPKFFMRGPQRLRSLFATNLPGEISASRKLSFAGALLTAGSLACTAQAGVLYSNISDSYPGVVPNFYNTAAESNLIFMGTTFTTTGEGFLGSLSFAVRSSNGSFDVGLFSSAGGQPDSLLETYNGSAPTFLDPAPVTLITVASTTHPYLNSATNYWLLITVNPRENMTWYFNDVGVTGGIYVGTATNELIRIFAEFADPSIRLVSSDVPLPATLALLGLGLIGIARQRSSRSTGKGATR